MLRINIRTHQRCELVDITHEVTNAIKENEVTDGILLIYCPHTTAGITINENADPSVPGDIKMKTSKLIEHRDPEYRHMEGNSDSHIKSSLIGASEIVIIKNRKPVLGTWQGIFFAEFDGPRSRNVFLKIIPG
jgi:secondary thiamine-phosphate synthase enzyme